MCCCGCVLYRQIQRLQSLFPQSTQKAIHILNQELEHLLFRRDEEFWAAVLGDQTVPVFVDSFLKFRRRVHDSISRTNASSESSIGIPASGDTEASVSLLRRVFMLILRLASPAPAALFGGEEGAQGKALERAGLVTVTHLMDAAAIYGQLNPQLTGLLLSSAFSINPNLWSALVDISRPLAANLSDVCNRTLHAAR